MYNYMIYFLKYITIVISNVILVYCFGKFNIIDWY